MVLVYIGIFAYIWVIYGANVGKYSIHGSYGYGIRWLEDGWKMVGRWLEDGWKMVGRWLEDGNNME